MRPRSPVPGILLAIALPAMGVAAQNARDLRVGDYEKREAEALFEAGQRHLQIGTWARKVGLVPQATGQFLRAVEVSEGRNQGAVTVLGIMRGLGDAFWRGERRQPAKALLQQFQDRVDDAERRTRKARLELAKRALGIERVEAAQAHVLAALRSGGELAVDGKGRARLDGMPVPDELADWLAGQTVTVEGERRVFEGAGPTAPRLPGLRELREARLLLRTDLPAAPAAELQAVALALLPALQEHLGGAPTRPLGLLVLGRREDYAAYLKACGMEAYAEAAGVADAGTFQTVVCAEGLPTAQLHGLVLHELTHLFWYGTAPAVMPDWYAEGLAETFGGEGTFTWTEGRLQVGGPMARERLEAVRQAPMPLQALLDGDALRVLATDRQAGMRFYCQSWALLRFLRDPECPWHARFEHWQANCRGAVLGAQPGQKAGDGLPARALWQRLFAEDQDALEKAFLAWLARQ